MCQQRRPDPHEREQRADIEPLDPRHVRAIVEAPPAGRADQIAIEPGAGQIARSEPLGVAGSAERGQEGVDGVGLEMGRDDGAEGIAVDVAHVRPVIDPDPADAQEVGGPYAISARFDAVRLDLATHGATPVRRNKQSIRDCRWIATAVSD